MTTQISAIRETLKNTLSEERYEHSISVSYTCMNLAMCHGGDLEQAELAGLLHDCAKGFFAPELLTLCKRNHIALKDCDKKVPSILHALYGSWLAKRKYQVDDQEILSAIACHTTGKPDMMQLEKILYVADYIEPRRRCAANLPEIRAIAFKDLDGCLRRILEDTLIHLETQHSVIHPLSIQALEFYQRKEFNQ